jgi:hypothetical protein
MDPLSTSALASGQVIQTISDIVNIANRIGDNSKTTSLVEFTSAARVEPLTLVSSDCINLEYLPDVLQSLQSLFTGYYLQAVSLTATIGDVKVIKLLDKLNPSRTPTLGSFSNESYNEDWRLSAESYKHKLPTSKNKISLEAKDDKKDDNSIDIKFDKAKNKVDQDTLMDIRELTNLSVGKLIKVTIKGPDGKDAYEIPISVRLMVNQLPEQSMTHLLGMGNADVTLTERYHAWRSGRIGFIKDLVFCQDLITEHKKALMHDKDGSYSEIIRRVNNNKKAGLISNNPSLATASNLVVISDVCARNVEDKIGGKLSNIRFRDKIFDATYIMILVVIDRQAERITFYHRGIAAATNVGLRDMKVGNKNSGPDITDIMKAFVLGNNPAI